MSILRKNIAIPLTILILLMTGVGAVLAGDFREIDPGGLRLTYRSRVSGDSAWVTYQDTMIRTRENGVDQYRIELAEDTGKKTVALVQARDWRPVLTQTFDQTGQRVARIEYKDGSAHFDMPSQKLDRSIKLDGDYYDNSTLYHFLRAFPFGTNKRINFNLVMDGRGGSMVGPIGIYVQEIGRERIQVPAGAFDSFKLEMGVSGPVGLFAGKYKYYFWYTASEQHYLVKYQDKAGSGVTELMAREKWGD